MKAAEVCGLASMIGILGSIITLLLMVGLGNLLATPGPMLLLRDFNAANQLHLLLAACNVMTFWYITTLAIGLAKLSGAPVIKAGLWLFLPWAVLKCGAVWLSVLAQKL